MPLKPIVLKGEQKRVLFLQVTDPIQIKGVAGSGKTTVALYRAKHLLDTQSNLFQEAKVVIFTFNKTLVKYINAITPMISGGYQPDNDEIKPIKPKGLNVSVTNFHKWAYNFIKIHGTNLYGKTVMGEQQKNIIEAAIYKYNRMSSNKTTKTIDFFWRKFLGSRGKSFKQKMNILTQKELVGVRTIE